ncbi:BUG/TctC family periplasmic protein (plasmid) [Cupriavidus sp. U2]|uniref:Bug family tripartite tricarboxylate transporter substrate binding protein n=1 Tax=Cupriavidus sp. U2 TaxID=2920269 RepID=UPI00129DEA53|nr:tripartite tricarboxylate transporter substrate binding protein [Cupriavidus sp. U2]KAI3590328.1 BUG/TctC family periplasmic protein [Cupriavidus sp. U2]
MRSILTIVFGIIISFTAASSSLAESYPSKPVRVVMPFAAGSPTDALARIITTALSTRLKQAFIVDNKPGASGIIGTDTVAKSTADGYTLLFSTNTTQIANQFLFKRIPYNPSKDFSAIAVVGGVPHVLVVNPSLPVKSVSELIQYAKSHPDQIAFPYANSTTRITGSTFRVMTGTAITAVPYKTYPQAVSELLAGQTQMMFIDFATGLPHIRSGKLRPLAVTPNRSSKLPDVPSVSDSLPGFQIGNWAGLFAPAGTPNDIIARLNREVTAIMADAEVQKQIDGIGYELMKPMSPAAFQDFTISERQHYAEIVRKAGIQPE